MPAALNSANSLPACLPYMYVREPCPPTSRTLTRRCGRPQGEHRGVGGGCGVGVMTIYGYVRTKEELLALLADR